MASSSRNAAFVGVLGVLAVGPTLLGAHTAVAAPHLNEIVFRVSVESRRGGAVLCALYRYEDTWLSRSTLRATRDDVSGATAVCRFSKLPRGMYAIAALHDEDGDGEMDTGVFGLPEEGYACSRNAQFETFLAPRWDDALFHHRNGVTVQTATMKY